MNRNEVLASVRAICIMLAVLAAVYPLEDGNLVVRAMMVLCPLITMLVICWIVGKFWKVN